jgi:hypothetical protein
MIQRLKCPILFVFLRVSFFEKYLNFLVKSFLFQFWFSFFKGKGPLKEYYQKKFEQKNYKNIKVFFLWLEPSDYPSLLGNY